MPKLRVRRIGSSQARCRCCGSEATLTVAETRYVRSWSRALDPTFDPAPARSATCSVCVMTYPIRGTDCTAEPAARRRDTAGEPEGRDWSYPSERQVPAARR